MGSAAMLAPFSNGGLIAAIIALGYYGLVLLLFGNLVLLLIKKGSSIPNRYGKSPTAFSFAG